MGKIVITGGEFQNKGAQSMTYIVIDEMKKRFPMYEIVVVSPFDAEMEQKNLSFKVIDMPSLIPVLMRTSIKQWLYYTIKGYNREKVLEADAFFRDVDLMIDVSGFALGSAWNEYENEAYLNKIMCAKHYNIPMIIMPQSFGPFNYPNEYRRRLLKKIKKYLSYPIVVFAREKRGFDMLVEDFHLQNVQNHCDMVLNNKGIDLNSIYINVPKTKKIQIKSNSVAFMPSSTAANAKNDAQMFALYKHIVSTLVSLQKNVYLMYHSNIDKDITEELANSFGECNQVFYLSEELNSNDFSDLIETFDYAISSRYHAIVHAYKKGVPCLTIGWADKYFELLSMFNQERYLFDVHSIPSEKCIDEAIVDLDGSWRRESLVINEIVRKAQEHNIFDIVQNVIKK